MHVDHILHTLVIMQTRTAFSDSEALTQHTSSASGAFKFESDSESSDSDTSAAVLGPFEIVTCDPKTKKFAFTGDDDVLHTLTSFGGKPFKIVCVGGRYR